MQVPLLRQSGRPSDLANRELYDQNWKLLFDKAELKADKIFAKTTGKLVRTPRMFVLERLLRFIERQLTLKYGAEEIVTLPTTAKKWSELSDKYGGDPILVARKQDNSKLVLIIMDTLSG